MNPSDPDSAFAPVRIGIDIGGTFTDFVIFDPASGQIDTFKLPSTPHDPAQAVLAGLARLRGSNAIQFSGARPAPVDRPLHIIHGSTVATNALLERKGACTALITTQGFRDVLQIGRQNRPQLYDLASAPPEPLVPARLRFDLAERMDAHGNILSPLDENRLEAILAELQAPPDSSQPPVTSIAVVFLFSFTNPAHEQRVAGRLREKGYFVSSSHEILPEYREYERTSTTVVNAYVSPVLDGYLEKLENALGYLGKVSGHSLQIMQSNGGSISVAEARKAGVRCILSGPAGGVVGCQFIGQQATASLAVERLRLLTFDMGGTSTDVSLIEGQPQITSEAEVGGLPIRIPLLDIHTIGAGGGSIASIDAGGALRVGPQSAGADPGPACYGKIGDKGQKPFATVTDANLLLGRLLPDHFLGGQMPLYPQLAEAAIAPLARQLGLTLEQTALGIIEIANAHMEHALRVISVERGHDPRQFTLLSFGGAGGLHAADLARRLHIPRLLIPPFAATLSALGMLAANVVKDYTHTVMLPGQVSWSDLQARMEPLLRRGLQEIYCEGFSDEKILLEPALDMRYRGQSYELTIPFSENFSADFHEAHRQTYGYARREADLEIVNLRLRATGVVVAPQITAHPPGEADPAQALIGLRPVNIGSGDPIPIPFYRGESLKPANRIQGPAIIARDDTTIFVPPNDCAKVDSYYNVIISIGAG